MFHLSIPEKRRKAPLSSISEKADIFPRHTERQGDGVVGISLFCPTTAKIFHLSSEERGEKATMFLGGFEKGVKKRRFFGKKFRSSVRKAIRQC